MRITEIYIKNFGRLKNVRITPGEKITVIHGGNESGKSTLAAFIKFIFYGLAQKEKWDGLSERERYFSWGESSVSGNLTLTTNDGRHFRIEREQKGAKRSSESFTIVDLDNGSMIKNEAPCDYFLGGIPQDVFIKTCFISQHGGSQVSGDKIKTAIENMVLGGSEDTDTKNALSLLDKTRTKLLHKNEKGGLIYDLSKKLEAYKKERADGLELEKNNTELERKLEADQKLLIELKEQLNELSKAIDISQTVARLEQLRQAISQKETFRKSKLEFEKIKEENTVCGFLPNREYAQELDGINRSLEFKEEQIDTLNSELDIIERKRRELADGAESLIFAGEKKEEIEHVSAKKRKLPIFSALFFSLFALFTLTAVFIPVLFIPSAVLLFAAIFVTSKNVKLKKQLDEIYKQCGVKDLDGFQAALNRFNSISTDLEKLDAKKELLKNQLENAENEQITLQKRFDVLANKWHGDYLNRAELISNIYSFLDEYAKRERDIIRQEQNFNGIRDDYIKKEFSELSEKARGYDAPPIPLHMIFEKSDEKKALERKIETLQSSLSKIQTEILARRMKMPDISELDDRISSLEKRLGSALSCLSAIKIAYAALEEASANTRNRFAPDLSKNASQLVNSISNGKYRSINIDRELSVSFYDGERTENLSYLSEGTKAMVYNAFRLSLTAELFDDIPPMVYDESFVYFDKNRLAESMKIINEYCSSHNSQAFILTCSEREWEILSGMNDSFIVKSEL